MNIRIKSLAIAVAITSVFPVAAQQTNTDEVEEIVVTGQKLTQSIDDVTSSVEVTTAEEISREPIADLYDIVDRIPNVISSFGGSGFAIRGVDQRGISGSGATLTVYVDDSPLSNQTTFFGPLDSWDLEQVEVYRGPQSTNFGRNSLAGAIYVRTQDPKYEPDFKLRAEVGNNGLAQGAIAGGGAIVDDVFAYRISANYRDTDGFITNTFLDEDADATELRTGRLKLLWEPSDSVRIISTSSYTENFAGEDAILPTNGVPGAILDASDVKREAAYDQRGREGTESFIQSLNLNWQINDLWKFQSVTTYQDTEYVRIEDFDSTPLPIAALDRAGPSEALSQEFRLRYSGENLQAALGFYYLDTDGGFIDTFQVPASLINPAFPNSVIIGRVGERKENVENKAVFFDAEYRLSDQLDLLFGARYDNEDVDNSTSTVTSLVTPPPPGFEFLIPLVASLNENQATEASFDAFLPKVGLRWHASDSTTLAFVVQRAYQAGGSDINFATGGVEDYDPEFLWNYEFSVKTRLLDDRLNWNTNIYYSDWSDQQVSEPLPAPFNRFNRTINAGESTLSGLESDISFDVNNNLEVYAGLGYSKTEFKNFPNGSFNPALPVSIANPTNFNGNSFPSAPEWSINAGLDYKSDGWFGGVDVNYQSDFYGRSNNFPINKDTARTLVNARIGYQFSDSIQLTAYAKNLFDEQYFSVLNRSERGNEFSRLGDERIVALRLDINY